MSPFQMRPILFAMLPLLGIALLGTVPHQRGWSKGERFARTHCGTCHLCPSPDIFPKAHWEQQILPRMALFMGIYPNDSTRNALTGRGGAFPDTPLISIETWGAIRSYYLQESPKNSPYPALPQATSGLLGFRVHIPDAKIIPPGTSMVHFGENGVLYIGDVYTKKLFMFDTAFNLLKQGVLGEGIVGMRTTMDSWWFTVMGSFSPTDTPTGFLLKIDLATGMGLRAIENLRRPVFTDFGDLNSDAIPDIAICEFGRYQGGLAWYEVTKDSIKRHSLFERPGAIRCAVRDVDNDGDMDITALFGQGDEGIWQFLNDGNGGFKPQNLLRFGPGNGSSYFDFFDFNKDGLLDILYCCGDDADFRPVPKPWHGIYVFLNKGAKGYQKHLFLPLPGAYKALPRDYDNDGDLDIAAISFFPDFERTPEQGFVFFQNEGKNTFKRFTFPESAQGRWVCMEEGDPDGDGDIDLILGNMTFEVSGKPELAKHWKERGLPFLVLENLEKTSE